MASSAGVVVVAASCLSSSLYARKVERAWGKQAVRRCFGMPMLFPAWRIVVEMEEGRISISRGAVGWRREVRVA